MDDSFDVALSKLDTSNLVFEHLQETSTTIQKTDNEISNSKNENINAIIQNANPSDNANQQVTQEATDLLPNTSKNVSKTHCLLVSPKQKGNPLLKAVSNVPWEFDDIIPDYQMGSKCCALFLSLKYHNLNPDYIHERLKKLGKMYELRVLLVLIDIDDPHQPLKHLARICILADLTLMLAWTFEEAGKIIETYKIYENKPPDSIKEKSEEYPYLKLVQALTTIKPINKTDAMTLIAKFGTLQSIIEASEYQLSQCPGLGPRKAKKLFVTLRENFCR